jgi:hypothetical protein
MIAVAIKDDLLRRLGPAGGAHDDLQGKEGVVRSPPLQQKERTGGQRGERG